MDTADVVMLSLMWVSLVAALLLSIGVFAVVSCRRVLGKAHQGGSKEHQVVPQTTDTQRTLETFPENCAIRMDGVKRTGSNYWQQQASGSAAKTVNKRVSAKVGVFNDVQTDADYEGTMAYNTECGLKQDVNPTHAVNPQMFQEDCVLDSTRTLASAQRQQTPIDYKFSTPAQGRSFSKVTEFKQNKENDIFSLGKEGSSPMMVPEMGREFALMSTIAQGTSIEKVNGALKLKSRQKNDTNENAGDSSSSSKKTARRSNKAKKGGSKPLQASKNATNLVHVESL